MAIAIFMLIFWPGFERFRLKKPTLRVEHTFRPPRKYEARDQNRPSSVRKG